MWPHAQPVCNGMPQESATFCLNLGSSCVEGCCTPAGCAPKCCRGCPNAVPESFARPRKLWGPQEVRTDGGRRGSAPPRDVSLKMKGASWGSLFLVNAPHPPPSPPIVPSPTADGHPSAREAGRSGGGVLTGSGVGGAPGGVSGVLGALWGVLGCWGVGVLGCWGGAGGGVRGRDVAMARRLRRRPDSDAQCMSPWARGGHVCAHPCPAQAHADTCAPAPAGPHRR